MMTEQRYAELISGAIDWDDLTREELADLESRVDALVSLRILEGWTSIIPKTIQ